MESIRNLLVTSYERAATFMRADVSPNTLHRRVLETQPECNGEDGEYALVVVATTYVPKWRESHQITLTLAHDVQQGPEVKGRSTLDRDLVALAAGAEDDIKSMLEVPSIQAVMHDGKLNVDELGEMEGRCLWHVPYTARHLLYNDEISGDENKRMVQELSNIIFDDEMSLERIAGEVSLYRLRTFIHKCVTKDSFTTNGLSTDHFAVMNKIG